MRGKCKSKMRQLARASGCSHTALRASESEADSACETNTSHMLAGAMCHMVDEPDGNKRRAWWAAARLDWAGFSHEEHASRPDMLIWHPAHARPSHFRPHLGSPSRLSLLFVSSLHLHSLQSRCLGILKKKRGALSCHGQSRAGRTYPRVAA